MKPQEESNMHTVHDLDDLITEFLSDGIITAKERAVLLRKAEQLGIDRDEADLYIDAQQQKADQKIEAAVSRKRGGSCPYCGGSVPQLTDKCPHCGQNITADASEELQEIFDNLEDALVKFKSGEDFSKSKAEVERYVRKAKMYYENNPKVKRLLEEIAAESATAEVEAKKDEKKKARADFYKNNKKLIGGIVVAVLIALLYVGCNIYNSIESAKPENNPQKTMELAFQSIKDGNIEQALAYCAAYEKEHYSSDIYDAKLAIIDAYIEKGEYEKAEGVFNNRSNEEAYLGFLGKCVLKMAEKGEKDKARQFIKAKSHFTNWEEKNKEYEETLMNILK